MTKSNNADTWQVLNMFLLSKICSLSKNGFQCRFLLEDFCLREKTKKLRRDASSLTAKMKFFVKTVNDKKLQLKYLTGF